MEMEMEMEMEIERERERERAVGMREQCTFITVTLIYI